MIYMITAALGFATMENIATALRVSNSFELLTLRFVGANLLHSLASGIVGYYWAKALIRNQFVKNIFIGVTLATIIHAVFNFLMLQWGPGARVSLFLVFLAFFVLKDFELLKRFSPIP
jgi:RsiW-degrading membrane proteinase PrsW (M82 family)